MVEDTLLMYVCRSAAHDRMSWRLAYARRVISFGSSFRFRASVAVVAMQLSE